MRVKQRLNINTVVSVAAAMVVLLVFASALYRLDNANSAARIAGEIITNAFTRVTLRNDYLRNNNERAKNQWLARHDAIAVDLMAALQRFPAAEDQKAIDEMLKHHASIGNIFPAIVENREKAKVTATEVAIALEVEDRLLNQLNMKSYEVVVHGRELLESSRRTSDLIIRQAGFSIGGACLVLLMVVAINSWAMGRAIAARVSRLRDGALLIGDGELDYRIDVQGDDEFAELSTAFNAMTAKLQASYRELEVINQELEAFAYSISHDLRQPLRVIAGFAGFTVDDYAERLDDRGRDYLERISQGAVRMGQLIEDLLYLSKVSQQEIAKERLDLSAMAKVVVAELQAAEPARRVGIKIAQGIQAFADQRLLEVVLSNLLGNAWKFTAQTPEARLEFGILPAPAPLPANNIIYFVRDNGAGFDPEYRDKLFKPFHRLHADREFPGTGIGLAIVERVIRRHGGKVWAEGEPGQGATICFTLPGPESDFS